MKKGEIVRIVSNLGPENKYKNNSYFYKGTIDVVPLGTKGMFLNKKDGQHHVFLKKQDAIWRFHPSEIEIVDNWKNAVSVYPNIKKIPAHPIFELSRESDVLLIDGQVYCADTECSTPYGKFNKNVFLGLFEKSISVNHIGSYQDLDTMFQQRALISLSNLEQRYKEDLLNRLPTFRKRSQKLDVGQLIYQEIFPHMRSQGYQNKLLELLAENNKDEDFNQNQVEDKHQIDKNRLDSLVRDSLNEVERYKNSLEGIQKKRSVKDTKLDQIFGYKDTDDEENENPNQEIKILDKILSGRNVIISNKETYLLKEGKSSTRSNILLNKKIYSVSKKLDNEFINQGIQKIIAKKVKKDSIENQFSKEEVERLIISKYRDIDRIKDLSFFEEEDHGFKYKDGNFYAFIKIPEFAIESQYDGQLYKFSESKAAIYVARKNGSIAYGENFYVIGNNNHPFLHLERSEFAKICIGRQTFPSSGGTTGEVIAKRLRRVREVLLYGYTGIDNAYHECYRLKGSCNHCGGVDHYSRNRVNSVKDIPIIKGGKRK